MNELVAGYQGAAPTKAALPGRIREPMRVVEPLIVSPSEDLAMIAKSLQHRMPRAVRYLMDALGTPDAQSADLTSYLLFDAKFTQALIDIGYHDAGKRIDEIEEFLLGSEPRSAAASTI
jgi:NTE family protein